MQQDRATEWQMHAVSLRDHFAYIGDERTAKVHAMDYDVVPVIVTEQEDGEYWGWIVKGETRPVFITPHKKAFNINFPWGPEAEAKEGRGEIVRLSVEA